MTKPTRSQVQSVLAATALVGTILSSGMAANAAVYPGNLGTFSNSKGDTQDLFTLTNSGKTINVTGDLSGVNKYYLNNVQLVGLRSIYFVNSDGSIPAGLTAAANGGFVTDSVTKNQFAYKATTFSGYPGYDDGASGKGYPDGSQWLVIADPTLAGKSTSNTDTSGSFTFNESVKPFDIGLDYMLAGGQTGRAFFSEPSPIVTGPPVVATPEVGPAASFAGGSILLGMLVLARKRKSMRPA